MPETQVKLSVGGAEFEAHGPEAFVKALLAEWQKMVGLSQSGVETLPGRVQKPPPAPPKGTAPAPKGSTALDVRLFHRDEESRLITLRVLPPAGPSRGREALLLLIYAYRQTGEQEVMGTKLRRALTLSGLNPPEIGREIGPFVKEALLIQIGTRKAVRYRLTNSGLAKADAMVQRLVADMA